MTIKRTIGDSSILVTLTDEELANAHEEYDLNVFTEDLKKEYYLDEYDESTIRNILAKEWIEILHERDEYWGAWWLALKILANRYNLCTLKDKNFWKKQ